MYQNVSKCCQNALQQSKIGMKIHGYSTSENNRPPLGPWGGVGPQKHPKSCIFIGFHKVFEQKWVGPGPPGPGAPLPPPIFAQKPCENQ